MRQKCFLFGIFLLFIFTGLPGASAKPRLETDLAPSKLYLHEIITLTIEVSWPKSDGDFSLLFPEIQTEKLDLIRQGESKEVFLQENISWTKTTFTLTFRAIEAGKTKIPAFEIPYIDPATQKGGTLDVSDEAIEIRPLPFYRSIPASLLGSALLAAGSLIFGVRLWLRRRQKKSLAEMVPEYTTADKISRDLAQLMERTGRMSSREGIKEFGLLFQRFLTEFYELEKRFQTAEEIFRFFESKAIASDEKRKILNLAEQLQQLKYAESGPAEEGLKSLGRQLSVLIQSKQIAGKV